LSRDPGRVTIRSVPRPIRKVVETPESRALDAVVREFDDVEDRLRTLRDEMKEKAIAAVRAGMSRAEAARRAKYSREYMSRLVSEANERDGWTPDAGPAA
jgi:hypothetical protein